MAPGHLIYLTGWSLFMKCKGNPVPWQGQNYAYFVIQLFINYLFIYNLDKLL